METVEEVGVGVRWFFLVFGLLYIVVNGKTIQIYYNSQGVSFLDYIGPGLLMAVGASCCLLAVSSKRRFQRAIALLRMVLE